MAPRDSALFPTSPRTPGQELASLNQAREARTATMLPNGQVLAAGGEVKNSSGGFTILAGAEI